MIGLLSYLWFTQWDVEVNKLFFADKKECKND